MSSHTGKTAVVIGGTSGIGRAISAALVRRGVEILVTGSSESSVAAARDALGAGAHAVRSDVTNLADVDALADQVAQSLGGIDALFVNQGYAALAPFAEVTEAAYDRHFAVNAKGAFFILQRLTPLVRDGGAIVVTTSVADEGGSPGMVAYSGSKAALWSFAQTLAAELLPRRIRVNAVSPGFIDTPSMGMDATAELRREFSRIGDEVTPMRRHGTPEEIASAALFLAFDATFTTATKLHADGGLGRRLSPADA